MSRLEELGLFPKAPDPRPAGEIDDEVVEELSFHLSMSAREGVESGLTPEEARAAAEARFGDFDRIRETCRRIQIGERIVLQRLHLVVTVGLFAALVFVALESRSSRRESGAALAAVRNELSAIHRTLTEDQEARSARGPVDLGSMLQSSPGLREAIAAAALDPEKPRAPTPEEWLARFEESPGWRAGLALGYELAALPPEEGLAVLNAVYPSISSIDHRQQVLKAFVFTGHPEALSVLHLGATDSELAVQGWAFGYLKDYAFQDFTDDYAAYEDWHAAYGDKPLSVVLTENARAFAVRLEMLDRADLEATLRAFRSLRLGVGAKAGVDLAAALRQSGLVQTVERWVVDGEDELAETGLRWLADLELDEAWMRAYLLPRVEDPDTASTGLGASALRLLGHPRNAWAREPLERLMLAIEPAHDGSYYSVASALGEIGDPRSIPLMIGAIVADDTYKTRYGVGYFGLRPMTGVNYDESHDAAWWLEWWQENQDRLPAVIRGLAIPQVTLGD